MKRHFLLLAMLCPALCSLAQTDSTAGSAGRNAKDDTLHVGNLLIVKDGPQNEDSLHFHRHRYYRHGWHESKNISTNWLVLDLGLSNFNDKTDYASTAAQQFAPGATADWFHLRTIKSVNVNIWLFMQKINLVHHVVNLKYGLGIELNNYRYTENIKYLTNPTRVIMDTISYNKNKLAADYFTVPFMLNFNFMPHRRDGLGLSIGASAGYKYSSRQKLRNDQTGKHKTFDDFDMEPVKISWIGELGLGPVRLYGSYATKSMFKKGLDQTPYTLGLRFSNW
ncbi:MAG: outer membrane beta-barrel protein [Bacteroidota bacterium]|nr:outer membrane beta-barrel protein [Bacteroidota bacterium]MDP4253744.1 outer membrane beta-barrel protein [Bacteroidota bacterium]MDP4258219.1 outer membrane beta-barrel protein [Bacteroidota bacterium]